MIRSSWTLRVLLLLVVAALVPACGGGGGGGVARSIIVTLTSAATTSETGGTATFTVRLNKLPNANVTIDVSTSDATEGLVSAGGAPAANLTLTFTSANGTTAQTVTVTGQDDALTDGNIAYTIVLAPAVSTDTRFNGKNPADVNLTNNDNEVVGITVTPTTLTDMIEGQNRQFQVILGSPPTAPVTIPITVTTGVGQIKVSGPGSGGQQDTFDLVLDAGNMSDTVTVHGLDDGAQETTLAYLITTGDPTSADTAYNAITAANVDDVTGNLLDNDTVGITVTPTTATGGITLLTNEGGGTDTFRVRLGTAILGEITLTLTDTDADDSEGSFSAPTVVFNSGNATTFQTVTVTGLDDALDDGNVEYSITLTATNTGGNAADDPYIGQLVTVFVTNVDLDGEWTGPLPPGVSPGFSAPTATPGIALGSSGTIDDFEATDPSVVLGNSNASPSFEMFYRGRNQDGTKDDVIARTTDSVPTFATRTPSAFVLAGDGQNGSWKKVGVGLPSVVVGNLDQSGGTPVDTYIMFFSGRRSGFYDGIAWVVDGDGVTDPTLFPKYGTAFNAAPANPFFASTGVPGDFDEDIVKDATVIFDPADAGAEWKMWYTGEAGGIFQIGYASTNNSGGQPNNANWVRNSAPVIAAGSATSFMAEVSAPTVVYDSAVGVYRMYFTAHDTVRNRRTIGYAESADPDTGWVVFPTPIIVPDGTGTATWADQNVFSPTVMITNPGSTALGTGALNDILHIWYSGTGTGGAGIGHATVALTGP